MCDLQSAAIELAVVVREWSWILRNYLQQIVQKGMSTQAIVSSSVPNFERGLGFCFVSWCAICSVLLLIELPAAH